ncbi:putative glutamine amidotransferase YafJ [bacterium MnTg02]|nr:putative glutamine amidotransferase YafJ [bacterium MnTg02]
MCELLGMNANVPTDIRFSFSGLIRRGGQTGHHRDGWGIAFYEGRGCRTFHDPQASCESELANLVKSHSVKSRNVICHIRKATHGRVCLENTHPFTRELWGRNWAFAHNGKLKGVKSWPLKFYHPIGTTDSEHAFCWVLDQVRKRHPVPPKSELTLRRLVRKLADEVSARGVFNFLLSDSRALYCYCSTELTWLTRRAPFGKARLIDTELTVDFSKETTPRDIVTVIATRPLTHDEPWQVMTRGTLVSFRGGLPVRC